MNKRNAMLGAVAAAGLAALLWVAVRPGGEASPPAASAGAGASPADERAPSDTPGAPAAAREDAPAVPAPPTVSPDEPGAAEVSLPELPSDDEVVPRPGREAPTTEDRLATQKAALALIDRGIRNLDARRARAEASGDERAAQRSRIRIERLRKRRAAIEADIATLEGDR